jgi:hypothetical protein
VIINVDRLSKEIRMHKQGTSETPGDTGPSHLTGPESDEEKKAMPLYGPGYNADAAIARCFFRWARTGLKRSGFKVFHEILSLTPLRWKSVSLPVSAMPSAKPASADRTDELSNSSNRAKSRNPRQLGTSSDSCSEPLLYIYFTIYE